VLKDNEGNIFAKIEDTADGGKLTLMDETETVVGEIFSGGSGELVIRGEAFSDWRKGGTDIITITDRAIMQALLTANEGMECNAKDAPPSSPTNGDIHLASPTWDPDGDGNGEYVCYDGTAWQEVVDLPNYT